MLIYFVLCVLSFIRYVDISISTGKSASRSPKKRKMLSSSYSPPGATSLSERTKLIDSIPVETLKLGGTWRRLQCFRWSLESRILVRSFCLMCPTWKLANPTDENPLKIAENSIQKLSGSPTTLQISNNSQGNNTYHMHRKPPKTCTHRTRDRSILPPRALARSRPPHPVPQRVAGVGASGQHGRHTETSGGTASTRCSTWKYVEVRVATPGCCTLVEPSFWGGPNRRPGEPRQRPGRRRALGAQGGSKGRWIGVGRRFVNEVDLGRVLGI